MKKQSLKKLFVFIIAIMMFSLFPELIVAQNSNNTKCPKVNCPPGYICVKGICKKYFPFLTDTSYAKEILSVSSANSNVTSFQLMQTQNVSVKIYDATGRLVKTIANSKVPEGNHQIEWDSKDESGKAVPPGIYVLQLVAKNKSETMKLSVIN
jgi:FlgD Ig-like domain